MSLTLDIGDRTAELSDDGRYRYSLGRRWDAALPTVLFVMLNPSTADAEFDDPTIRKCIGFAKRWGAGGIHVVNLYALRATDPRELATARGPVGEFPWQPATRQPCNRNDVAIQEAASTADRVICAWGSTRGPIPHRAEYVLDELTRLGGTEALRVNQDGSPAHPLYLPYDLEPVSYP